MDTKELVNALAVYSEYGDKSYSVLTKFLTKELNMDRIFRFELDEEDRKIYTNGNVNEIYYSGCLYGILVTVEADTKLDEVYNFRLRAEIKANQFMIPISGESKYVSAYGSNDMRVSLELDDIGCLAALYEDSKFEFVSPWTIGHHNFLFTDDGSIIYEYLHDHLKDTFESPEIDIMDIMIYKLIFNNSLQWGIEVWYDDYVNNFMKYILMEKEDYEDDGVYFDPSTHLTGDRKLYYDMLNDPDDMLSYTNTIYEALKLPKQ